MVVMLGITDKFHWAVLPVIAGSHRAALQIITVFPRVDLLATAELRPVNLFHELLKIWKALPPPLLW